VITPAAGLRNGRTFTTVVTYDGQPQPIDDPEIGASGFLRSDDGVTVAGEPHAAATWFPVDDHPSDKAAYTFRVTVPNGRSVVANGLFAGKAAHPDGTATWTWNAADPMASYLATISVGRYDVTSYDRDGIRFTDAVDASLDGPTVKAARTGQRTAYSGAEVPAYKRLTHTVDVPAGGATLSFGAVLETADTGYLMVEAHTVGQDNWTTLPEQSGLTFDYAGELCHDLDTHPFLAHYVSQQPDGTCSPDGTTGHWNGQSSFNYGGEFGDWTIDLKPFAGTKTEVAVTYLTTVPQPDEDSTPRTGVYLDDIKVSTGHGDTSFENDGNTWDGWALPPAPAGSPANPSTWRSLTVARLPMSATGQIAHASFAREPEMLAFMARSFGPYPFDTAGGIVSPALFDFALETQTRPTYNTGFFGWQDIADSTVVHELAHQWYGDNVSIKQWKDTWLNEGFATYAQWLWSEHEGRTSAQGQFDYSYSEIPADDSSWNTPLADPGVDGALGGAVYGRGAMALQALRMTVGDSAFFKILKTWTAERSGGNGNSHDFAALASRVAGRDLSGFFTAWVFSAGKPPYPGASGPNAKVTAGPPRHGLPGLLPTGRTVRY
jgi:peptidase M1-like protein